MPVGEGTISAKPVLAPASSADRPATTPYRYWWAVILLLSLAGWAMILSIGWVLWGLL
jgi:hypothetical protein